VMTPRAETRVEAPTVFLVGMMGAGKSSVGRALAERLERPFLDSDAEIEASAGTSIAEIFATRGEAFFRELETRTLRELPAEGAVVALGGGAFVSDENRAIIESKGISIWLDATIDTLVARTEASAERPLLAGLSPQERAVRLRALAAQRGPAYAQAKHRIRTDDQTSEQLAAHIARELGLESCEGESR